MRSACRKLRLWLVFGFGGAPVLCGVGLLLAFAGAVLAPLATVGAGGIIDGLTLGDDAQVRSSLILAAIAIAVSALQSGSSTLVWSFVGDLGDRYGRHKIMQLISGIPTISHHERPEIADRVALVKADSRRLAMTGQLTAMNVASVAGGVTIAVVLGSILWWLPLLVLAAFVPAWASGRRARARIGAERDHAHAVRTGDRMLELARDPGTGIEVRCSGAGATLVDVADSALFARERAVVAAGRRARTWDVTARLLWTILLAVSLGAVFYQVRRGSQPVGALVVLVLLVPQIEAVVTGLSGTTSFLVETSQQLDRLDALLEYAAEAAGPVNPLPVPAQICDALRMANVTFSYPDSKRAAVRNVTLTLKPGTSVAIVGQNGAGKTTLVKLLAKLYEPSDGSLEVDGVPLSLLDPRDWHERISAVFQDHLNPEFTAREAVGVGDLHGSGDGEVQRALTKASAQRIVEQLPQGLGSQLGGRFQRGVDLSGGQWQRLAIARGFMRQSPLLILLDEPSSALDPESEEEILSGYAARAREFGRRGGLTVIVSHRMSTVRRVDRIIYMHDGQVVEDGTHQQLMALNGRYAQMFELQARAYR